ncbi:Fic family protein [Curvibacter sp. CHRR-16]|uniref:Fic family protein n=1 Tax=Curvibacter sp. CHRR-16 TaxID=2835872 RepID=UPI001BDA51DD|nr:Fic family protein [Curvibacter sp. CHRR-16]MBT0571301.1 Fic family protein [Curvibacter sp. CHRR-16]
MSEVGYAWIQSALAAPDFLGARRARLASISRVERAADGSLLVPHKLKPEPTLLQHALFALKYEGVELGLLLHTLQQVSPQDLSALVLAAPNSMYGRKLGYLWERWHGRKLPGLDALQVAAAYVPLFDPDAYFVGSPQRDSRWRMEYNGLGEWDFCPVVRKTPAIAELVQQNILQQAQVFAQSVGQAMLERALAWAYLSETEGSFAIEGEAPSHSKATLFAALLRRAHDQRPITQEMLVELQNAAISNPFDKAVQFRTEQNRLQRDVRGAAGVTYVPPAPDLAAQLMQGLMRFGNQRPATLDALVHAAVVSFAFVFIHPFMDGNGRLSRFLIHHCLGQSGLLPQQFLLPISVSMKRHESAYLQALTAFSKPARALCEVQWAGDEHYSYEWASGAAIWFRTMDLTEAVAFTLEMAQASLSTHLREEVEFLALFDRVQRYIDARYDLRNSDLSTLIVTIHQNGGTLSNNRRKRFAERVQAHVLDAIEQAVQRAMKGRALDTETDDEV